MRGGGLVGGVHDMPACQTVVESNLGSLEDLLLSRCSADFNVGAIIFNLNLCPLGPRGCEVGVGRGGGLLLICELGLYARLARTYEVVQACEPEHPAEIILHGGVVVCGCVLFWMQRETPTANPQLVRASRLTLEG